MLRIIQNSHVGGAKSYYSSADYYSEGQELIGRWRGDGARLLGIAGDVTQPEWDFLCDNLHPQTGEQLTPRWKNNRTVGYDFNFHVPKSLSLLYAMTRDERLLEAFRDAVDATMRDIESEIRTRVRQGGQNEDRLTGNMVWGEFVHLTSRPVEGIPDPHLHAHCFAFNTTFDAKENAWKAGQFRGLKRDAPYFEALFHSRLAYSLRELGLPIERTKKRWELAGVSDKLIEKFSRRTAQIEEKARELGLEQAQAKAELGAKTRERKQTNLCFGELQKSWSARMTEQERAVLEKLASRIGGDGEPVDDKDAARGVEHAISHCFERQSVLPERKILEIALRKTVGTTTIDAIREKTSGCGLIVGELEGRRMVTTRGVLGQERRLVAFAKNGRGTCWQIGNVRALKNDWLNADQQKSAREVLESRDRVILLRGRAGTGKTTLMKEVVTAIEEAGTKVFAFAPSAAASRGVLRQEGFEADTVSRLLVDEKLQARVASQLIWIDEAGLLGMKTLAAVFALAEKLDARVLLTGDRNQHGPVERGAALRLLEEEAGLKPADLKDIQRQRGEYKAAIQAFAEGMTGEGLDRLDRLGWVKEIPEEDCYHRLAADYVDAAAQGKTALVVSPTHAEAERIDQEIRDALRKVNVIRAEERTFRALQNANLTEAERRDAVNYHPRDMLQFHQNAKGFKRGERLIVTDTKALPLDQAARFQVFRTKELKLAAGDLVRITHNGKSADNHRLDNGMTYRIKRFDADGNIILTNGWTIEKDFGHLAYGYVVTSHASQGRTVDRVFIGQSSDSLAASSREQIYVSCSRARESATVYTDDKEALRQAIDRSDERLTATEFINGVVHRQMLALHEPSPSINAQQAMRREGRRDIRYCA